jgi:ectoine hydroxylase-related dioxygenase (phytanoyl-CoA dioxygenase family)
MNFTPLTDEQRRSFDQDGYLIVRNALNAESVARLVAAGDRLMDGFEFEGFYAHRRDGLVQRQPFSELATNSAIVPLIIQLLGHNLHITNTALIYKHPQPLESAENPNWHRDVGVSLDLGHENLPRVGLKVGYCLTDFTEVNSGATLFVKGSNGLPAPLTIPKGALHPSEYEEISMKSGDAFLFESRTYHAPGINCQEHIAKAIIYGYHYRWVKTDHYMHHFNDQPQPDEELTKRLDDVGRQLLGARTDTRGGHDPNGLEWPLREWAAEHGLPNQFGHTVEV